MKAFLTGSRVYGTPRPDSDIDFVVLVGKDELLTLTALADNLAEKAESEGSLGSTRGKEDPGESLRFGKLNLICHTSQVVFEAWRDATAALKDVRPVTREAAIATIKTVVACALSRARVAS